MQRKLKRLHFVGVGGIGMAGLAELLHVQGYTISGDRLTFPPLKTGQNPKHTIEIRAVSVEDPTKPAGGLEIKVAKLDSDGKATTQGPTLTKRYFLTSLSSGWAPASSGQVTRTVVRMIRCSMPFPLYITTASPAHFSRLAAKKWVLVARLAAESALVVYPPCQLVLAIVADPECRLSCSRV